MLELMLALCCLQEARLRDHFGEVQEAWKALGECRKGAGLTDDTLRTLGRLAQAFEVAGLFDPDACFEARAVKTLVMKRASAIWPTDAEGLANRIRIILRDGIETQVPADALDQFEKAVAKLAELKQKGLDDEDNVQEAQVDLRKVLKQMGLIRDEMPQWQRRRIGRVAQALVTGEAYPAPAKAAPEQEKRIKDLIEQLGDADPERRDEAARELDKIGEPAVPFLREALKHSDGEVRERAKKLLGIGLREPADPPRAARRALGSALQDFERAIELRRAVDKDK